MARKKREKELQPNIKVRLDRRTIITVRDRSKLDFWREKYPALEILEESYDRPVEEEKKPAAKKPAAKPAAKKPVAKPAAKKPAAKPAAKKPAAKKPAAKKPAAKKPAAKPAKK
jgi:cell division septation protein DedD